MKGDVVVSTLRWVVVLVGALLLAGCSAGNGVPSPRLAATATAIPTSNATSVPATQAAPAPITADPLGAAVLALAEQGHLIRVDTSLNTARNALNDGQAGARAGLKATRAAAYTTAPRNCGEVEAQAVATRAGANAAGGAYDSIQPLLSTRQAQVDALAVAVSGLQSLLQEKVAEGLDPELAAAVAAAQEQVSEGQAVVDETRAAAEDGRAKSATMAASAEEILTKTC